jgi:cyclopropane fatty-acyl-phospholipid synthase-like methyltransferase
MQQVLSSPAVYNMWTFLTGSRRCRTFHARENIQARPGMRILDIGCGTGEILEYLPQVEYVGFDADRNYIAAAKRRYGTKGQFHCRLVDEFSIGAFDSFDIVLASGIIHHLDDEQSLALMRLAYAALVPAGRLVTWDGCFEDGQSALAKRLLKNDRGKYVRTLDGYLGIARQVFPNVQYSVRSDLLLIPYTICVMNCERGQSSEGLNLDKTTGSIAAR